MNKEKATQYILSVFEQKGLEPNQELRLHHHTIVHRVPLKEGDKLAIEWFENQYEVGLRLVFLWQGERTGRVEPRDSYFNVIWQKEEVQGPALNQVAGWYLWIDETSHDGAVHFEAIAFAKKHGLDPDKMALAVSDPTAERIVEDIFDIYLAGKI